jgi:phosphoglycerol transferase
MATLRANFTPSFVDSPELRGFTFNNRMFYCLGGLGVIAVFAWVFSRKLGAQLFVFLFLPLSILASSYFVNKELRQRLLTDVYDQAGIFAHQYLSPEEHSNLAIIASNPAGLFRSLFYIDNPAASIVEIPTGAPLEPSIIPPGKEWVLLIGDHEPLSNVRYQISNAGFSLIKVDGDDLVDFKRSSWPGTISRSSGLSIAESWGTWSNAREITLEFTGPLPKEFDLRLKAYAFGPNIDQPFLMSIGRDKQSFRLSSFPQDVSLFFQTDGDEKLIRIEVPAPISPMTLGLSGDERQLGIGLVELRIISTNKQVQKSE